MKQVLIHPLLFLFENVNMVLGLSWFSPHWETIVQLSIKMIFIFEGCWWQPPVTEAGLWFPSISCRKSAFWGLLVMDNWSDGLTTSWQTSHAVITAWFPPIHTHLPTPCPVYSRCVRSVAFLKHYGDSLPIQLWLGQSPWLPSMVDGKLCSVWVLQAQTNTLGRNKVGLGLAGDW